MHLCGDRETTGSTPLGMVIPSIEEEEEVEVEEDENGSMRDPQRDQMRGLGRGFSCGNGRAD